MSYIGEFVFNRGDRRYTRMSKVTTVSKIKIEGGAVGYEDVSRN